MSSEALRFRTRLFSILAVIASALVAPEALWRGGPTIVHAQQIVRGDGRRFYADDPLWRDPDMQSIQTVAFREAGETYDFVVNTFGEPGGPDGPALNVNTLGEVPDSSWFTNRIGRRDMSVEEIVRGPDTVDGPGPGVWTVTGRPTGGITPKFIIRDSRGDRYVIKLDPIDWPELPSSAEFISTKILRAIGYHVAENYVVEFHPSRLAIQPGATFRTETGERRSIRQEDLDHWLEGRPGGPAGLIRALASRYIPGKPAGEFRFWGTRADDPNDIYPHERRRELRGLRVFAAWLNHDDARSVNTFDTHIEDGGRRYIRHYLLDFGSTLGSGSTSVQHPRAGYEHLIERDKIRKGIATLGLWQRGWMKVEYPAYSSVGNYEAESFEPSTWKPEYPNAAFEQIDAADAFWGASIAARFTDEMIRAIVGAARISDPQAAAFLADAIIRRRDKVVDYWITSTNPLDRFEVHRRAGSGLELTFANAAVRVGAAPDAATYRVQWWAVDNLASREQPVSGEVSLSEPQAVVPPAAWGPPDDAGFRYAVAAIRTSHRAFPHWQAPVRVTLRDRGGAVDVVGIERSLAWARFREKAAGDGSEAHRN